MQSIAPDLLSSLKKALSRAAVGLLITDLDGRFVDGNEAFAEITGYTRDELRLMDLWGITHPDYVPSNRKLIRQLIAGELPSFVLQKEYVKKNGDLVWVQNSVSLHRDRLGAPANIVALCEDITERKVVQSALRESEERFRVQFKATPVPIFSWRNVGDDFVLVDYNDAADELTAHGIIKMLGRRASHLYQQTPVVIELMRQCFLEQRTIRQSGEFRLLSTGELKYLDVSFVFAPPNLVMIHTEDITERIAAEKARLEAERKYRNIFENANEGIFQSTPEGRFITVNPALARILGFDSPEELMRERTDIANQHYVDASRRAEMKQALENAPRIRGFEYEAYRKDGSRILISDSIRAVRDQSGAVLYYEGIAEDVTERRKADEALRSLPRRLMEAQEKERKQIARELHDEIGQVLTAVRMSLQAIEEGNDVTRASQICESIRVIDEALARVRDLSFDLRPSLLDDLGLAAATRWYSSRFGNRAGLKVVIKIDENLQSRLPRDVETACFRILQEALTNVARHAGARRVTVNLSCNQEVVTLSVKDDGRGVQPGPAEVQDPVTTLGIRGMEERALAASGRFKLTTAPGKGVEVRVTFPCAV